MGFPDAMTTTAYTGRTTMHNGIKMRSRLEAAFAAALDRGRVHWQYEPCAYQAPDGAQYLPDFRVRISIYHDVLAAAPTDANVYIEVKPTSLAMCEVSNSKVMRAIWHSEPDALLLAAAPADLAGALLTAPSGITHPMSWGSCRRCERLHLLTRGLQKCCGTLILRIDQLLPSDYSKAT